MRLGIKKKRFKNEHTAIKNAYAMPTRMARDMRGRSVASFQEARSNLSSGELGMLKIDDLLRFMEVKIVDF